jgi:hypothetical protein
MGGGASSNILKEALTGEKEFWTEAEKIENQESLERQKRASEFILKYMFLDVPVRLVKNSVDPMAPLWIEVDPDLVKSVLENENKALIDKVSDFFILLFHLSNNYYIYRQHYKVFHLVV